MNINPGINSRLSFGRWADDHITNHTLNYLENSPQIEINRDNFEKTKKNVGKDPDTIVGLMLKEVKRVPVFEYTLVKGNEAKTVKEEGLQFETFADITPSDIFNRKDIPVIEDHGNLKLIEQIKRSIGITSDGSEE